MLYTTVFAVLQLMILLASTHPTYASELQHERTLTISSVCNELDPMNIADDECYRLHADICEALIKIGPRGETVLGVAKDWEVEESSNTLIVYLKKDRFWSDGENVTSADFILNWKRIIQSDSNVPTKKTLLFITGAAEFVEGKSHDITGLQAIDKHTIKIQYNAPFTTLYTTLSALTTCPIPNHVYKLHGEQWSNRENVVNNGVYRLVENAPSTLNKQYNNNQLYLEVNPYHPEASTSNIKKISYGNADNKWQYSQDLIRESYLNKTIPLIISGFGGNYTKEAIQFLNQHGWEKRLDYTINASMYYLNRETVNSDVIEAIKYLLDPSIFSSRANQSETKPIYRLYNQPGDTSTIHNKYNISTSQRIKKATELLKKQGVTYKTPITLRILMLDSNRNEALVIGNILEKYGIKLDINSLEWNDFFEQRRHPEGQDLMGLNWFIDKDDSTDFYSSISWTNMPIFEEEVLEQFNQLALSATDPNNINPFITDPNSYLIPDKEIKRRLKLEEMFINDGAVALLYTMVYGAYIHNQVCGWESTFSTAHPTQWLSWCDEH